MTSAQAEIAIDSQLVLHSAILPVTEQAKMAPPFFGITHTIVAANKLDPVNDTLQYQVANLRITEADPYRPLVEEVAVAAIESNTTYFRIPNFEECPDIGLNP